MTWRTLTCIAMRTTTISSTTIEYPDVISFCFNPVVMNIYGKSWAYVEVTVIDVTSGTWHKEKRAMFGSACFFDLSFYMQSAFDATEFGKIDYSQSGAQDSQLGRLFSVSVDLYSTASSIGDSFQFYTFIIWGAMQIGERYNGDRTLTWFKNLPFTVGMYTAGAASVSVKADNVSKPAIALSERKVYNINLTGMDASRELVLTLPPGSAGSSVFDHTFDFTFQALSNTSATVRLLVNNCTEGVYLRWVSRHGYYCYWLFTRGDESKQVANDGEFIRNNMQDYSYVNGYHGGSGRKQRKTEENTLPVCAPLVDSDTYDFLFQLALSPLVDMYAGKDANGDDRWQAVNVAVDTYSKTRAVLQDFTAEIILPETRVQSL